MRRNTLFGLFTVSLLFAGIAVEAQDRFEKMPGYEEFRAAMTRMGGAGRDGRASSVKWIEGGKQVQFNKGGKKFLANLVTGEISEVIEEEEKEKPAQSNRPRRPRVARGRQAKESKSPDEKWTAIHRNWNLYIKNNETEGEYAVTSDGKRTYKYATGSWVYGEELRQNSAMWWSPDSTKIAFYVFDESKVKPFYLTEKLTEVQTTLDTEGYPKAGAPNPVVGLLVYDIESGEKTNIEIGDDKEQYVYNVRWMPDSSELLFNRTNRHQSVLDVMAADPASGNSRIILTEKQDTWQKNSPEFRWLADKERFIWETEKTGWKHYEIRHISGSLLNGLTSGEFPCGSIVKIDEQTGWLYFTAFSSDMPINAQLHRVRLDGTGQERLTKEELNYSAFSISPDHDSFVAVSETINTPPVTRVFNMNGETIATLAESDLSKLGDAPLPEIFTFKAEDGVTDIYGILYKPSNFDPAKKYPLLVDVYGGPLSQGVRNRFRAGNAYCEFGFLVAKIDNRGTVGRGKAFEGANYLKLGIVDIQDQADGVKFLAKRPYVDGSRVGIHGHSYGGFMSALAIVKYPDVFHVAVAGAPVTDWKNYDTIYTERYMRTPQENEEGYKDGSCLTYAEQLTGKLLLLHGMVDDNVHPNNSWQFVHELQKKKKPFTMMFFPTSGHGIGSPSVNPIKWEFLIDNLIGNG